MTGGRHWTGQPAAWSATSPRWRASSTAATTSVAPARRPAHRLQRPDRGGRAGAVNGDAAARSRCQGPAARCHCQPGMEGPPVPLAGTGPLLQGAGLSLVLRRRRVSGRRTRRPSRRRDDPSHEGSGITSLGAIPVGGASRKILRRSLRRHFLLRHQEKGNADDQEGSQEVPGRR